MLKGAIINVHVSPKSEKPTLRQKKKNGKDLLFIIKLPSGEYLPLSVSWHFKIGSCCNK